MPFHQVKKGKHFCALSELSDASESIESSGLHKTAWTEVKDCTGVIQCASGQQSFTISTEAESSDGGSTDGADSLEHSDDDDCEQMQSMRPPYSAIESYEPVPIGRASRDFVPAEIEITADFSGKRPVKREIRLADEEENKDSGVSFESLVDRLLSSPSSKSDLKFPAIFLCLYRKFAAPSELLLELITHFEEAGESGDPSSFQLSTQLRHLSVLQEWVSDYPGDFAHHLTRRIMTTFMQKLATSPSFVAAHREISPHLDVVSDDDDTEWACSDKSRSRASTTESFLTISSTRSAVSTVTADSSTEDIENFIPAKEDTQWSVKVSAAPLATSSSEKSVGQSTASFQTLLNNVENAQRQALLLTPMPRSVLDKQRWHQFMDLPEEQIARELTRIDWILYSSIRPRDLVRHVSLPGEKKNKCKSLQHVNRMVNQFNHVACWVANMILLRDKPKHRARALEKFMAVAWKLRYLNNYNSLGAIIAGINGTAVHRLVQTRELINPEARKQFMRLEILMGTQKSHFAYRLAWSNTSTPRIPFLPLHRRDLVFAEEGNRTFMTEKEGSRVNWKKFEIMGEVIIGIRKSQELPYPTIGKDEDIQRLVLDGKFTKDDDELYERSLQLEGPGVGEQIRKRFNWFQR